MKVCLIGPTYPFRGGISHYTTLLFRSLREKHDVHFFAFKRQYPGWLFPGNTDRDNSSIPICEEGVKWVLDSINPLTWLYVYSKVKKINPDLVIFPWWVAFWAPQFWTISSLIKLFTKSKILIICHNVTEHESNIVKKMFTKFVLSRGDFFIVHSREDCGSLNRLNPGVNVKQSFHPTYEIFNYNSLSKADARAKLGIQGKTILFFGFIRSYKGLKYLIEAIAILVQHIDVKLLIVGEFWEKEESYRKQIDDLGIDQYVTIINRYVSNEEVELYFAASDIVVQPYISATGSGIVQIAFGCNKPVIATNFGCLSEVIKNDKTGYIIPPRNSKAIVDAVLDFYKKKKEKEFSRNIIQEREKFSWSRMIETIEGFLI